MSPTKPRTDRYGFFIRDCGRCGGCGRYSYNTMHGDMCYGCGGKGIVHTAKAARAFAQWIEHVRIVREPCAMHLVVGDEIRDFGLPKAAPFVTVTAITDTGEACGWSTQPDGTKVVTSTYLVIDTDDGQSRRMSGAQLVRRKGDVPVAPYLLMQGKG